MQELGNSMPLSEGMIDAETESKKTQRSKVCLNCGAQLTGLYCSQCGQKNIPQRQTLGELSENFIGSFFSYESKFFRTIKLLLFKPGFLPVEYNAGRRERYYHPARMYVFISFIYFLLLFSLPTSDERSLSRQSDDIENQGARDSLRNNFNFQLTSDEYRDRSEYDSIQATLPESKRDGYFMRKLQYRNIELKTRFKDDEIGFVEEFADSFVANTPKVLFFLLPIFALLLKLLYIRRDFYYSEHLVFSIYFYNFFFAAGIITLLLQLIPLLDWFSTITFIVIGLYMLLAMKTMYKQSWKKTIAKFLLLSVTFFTCLGVGLFFNLAITLILL